ncbi:hypothetical protein FIB18_10955 [Brucella pecoris]|uniref:Uncharacterized protein n=1 Tax=Brucella pecoris TaxID=867683 RepID=A0A5C5CNI3_9HYPH|nr:hypothetical protein FIB18_10955 [Brucella pecoris]
MILLECIPKSVKRFSGCTVQNKHLERRSDSIRSQRALIAAAKDQLSTSLRLLSNTRHTRSSSWPSTCGQRSKKTSDPVAWGVRAAA